MEVTKPDQYIVVKKNTDGYTLHDFCCTALAADPVYEITNSNVELISISGFG
jgi:hypothetical protein